MTPVVVSQTDAILTIALNRPATRNAIDEDVLVALREAIGRARDPSIRAVVLTGSDGVFSDGLDVPAPHDAGFRSRKAIAPVVLGLRELEKPVIAALNGAATGPGLALALACDVRIAAVAATCAAGFVGVALAPEYGAAWFLRRLVGAGRAFELLATGRTIGAEEARILGLVSEVVPTAEFDHRVAEVAALFAAMPTRAVAETKRQLDAAGTTSLAEHLELEARTQGDLIATADHAAGRAVAGTGEQAVFDGRAVERLHPVRLLVHDDLRRWRLTVALRGLLVLPHLAVLLAWQLVLVPVLIVNWVITLVRGRTPDGLHAWTTRFVRYSIHVAAYEFLVSDPFPGFRGWLGTYPVDLEIDPPAPQSRWKTLFRLVLVIPAYALCYVLTAVLQALALVAWVVALALGRIPRGMRDLMAYCLRYQAQTYSYVFLLTSRYPSLASGSGFQFEEA